MTLCRAPYCIEPTTTPYDVCRMCWDYRAHWIEPMPWLWQRVHLSVAPSGTSGYAERVSTSRPGPSIPMRTGPVMAMETALQLVTVWADTFLRRGLVGHLPERHTVSDEYLFLRAVALCAGHDHTLTGGPLAGDYYLDIYKAHWALCRVDNARASAVQLTVPCPACNRSTVIERNAGEYGQCLTCARKWSQAALSREINGLAS